MLPVLISSALALRGRSGITRIEAEILELPAPVGIGITQALDIDATREAAFNRCLDELWARNANESVRLIWRTVQRSRFANCSGSVIELAMISSSHRRPRAIAPAFFRAARRGYPGGLRVIARPGTKVAVPAARCGVPDFSADRE
jgi:hypothetical protein